MKYIEIACEIIHQTPDAVLIFDGDDEIWVPRSCIEDGNETYQYGIPTTLDIAEWFALKEGLI